MFDALFPSHWSDIQKLMWLKILNGGSAAYETVTGAIVNFTAQRSAPLKSLLVSMSPVQAAGTPSPDNPLPISGYEGVTAYVAGVNLFDKSTAEAGKWLNVNTGVEENAGANYVLTAYIPVKGGVTYTMVNANSSRRWLYDAQKTPLNAISNSTFTPTIDGFARITLALAGHATLVDDFMLVVGSTLPAEYVPYVSGTTISVTFPDSVGTVYSGTLDVVTGVLTVNMAYLTFDGTDMTGIGVANTATEGYKRLNIALDTAGRPKAKPLESSSIVQNMVCNILPTKSGDSIYMRNTGIGTPRGGLSISAYYPDCQTVEAWQAFFEETPMSVAYEIETPVTYQLTPQEVLALVGENNVWSDGDVTVTYRSN